MYRPEGWENRYTIPTPTLEADAYEAAAMLEGLRRNGIRKGALSVSLQTGVNGYLIFIPDEE